MFNWLSKSDAIIGIDIGTSDLKIAQISRKSGKPVLDTYGIVNLSEHLSDSSSDEAIAKTADVLSKLLKQARAKSKRCVISLPSSAVFTLVVELPDMVEKELAGAIRFEAKKYIPMAIEEVILSWSVVGKQNGKQSVLLTAVPRQIKERYVQLFDLAGLDLEVIEIEALALIRSLVKDTQENCVIIDIGSKSTSINLVKGGFLQLSRSVSVGGDTVTERLADTLGVTFARAEQFKQDLGLTGAPFLPEIVRPVLASIRTETKQLLSIYQTRGVVVNKLVVVGGGASLYGTLESFGDLGVPVSFGDPLEGLEYPKEVESIIKIHGRRLSVAIGLALRV